MRWGTSHFISRAAANRYYGDPNWQARASDDNAAWPLSIAGEKEAAGEIHIGKPMTCEPDETVKLDRSEGRYFIEQAQ